MRTCKKCPNQYPSKNNPIPNDSDKCHTTFPQVYKSVLACQRKDGFEWSKEKCQCLSPKCKPKDPAIKRQAELCSKDKPFSYQSCQCDDPVELFEPQKDKEAKPLDGSTSQNLGRKGKNDLVFGSSISTVTVLCYVLINLL